MGKFRIPRKKKKKIPKGFYCYEPIEFHWDTGIYNVKTCEFECWKKLKDIPITQQEEGLEEWYLEYPEHEITWCRLLKCILDDSCKACSARID